MVCGQNLGNNSRNVKQNLAKNNHSWSSGTNTGLGSEVKNPLFSCGKNFSTSSFVYNAIIIMGWVYISKSFLVEPVADSEHKEPLAELPKISKEVEMEEEEEEEERM